MRMTDTQVQDFITEQRNLYHAGKLPKWKVKRLERISGWSWGGTTTPSLGIDPLKAAVEQWINQPAPVLGRRARA